MPGSSLWLLPPTSHPLNAILASLIQKVSAHFGSPHVFLPHVTLTSEIQPSSYSLDPQKWLNQIEFPEGKYVHVKFGRLNSEDVFVRKLYIKVSKSGVDKLGKTARMTVNGYEDEEAAKKWTEEKYVPHLSLLYHDCSQVPGKVIEAIEKMVREAGVSLEGKGELGGWEGGRVVLVPTDQPINTWDPIAEREL
ncbi:2',3'-cyclic-nucleotide 3'-phosphodiesterase [Lojkania enalia]|uniref:2',3'-cyclic-nucleotide 3'-phosphodiesterase n=1 Tax=Lojkania enalia TaxID=147567 RepID=A0A9P4KDU8_9PLEO|nr:2',3'-cyclic-nucleotide 3'-phosphodiesterase [Didymosphaeria enalia]